MKQMPKIRENVLETIGNTPMVKLNRIVEGFPCPVVAKYETFNPGNSIKDRMALKMVEDAEKDGKLQPGGTIIEGTSGNTGMGLAIAAACKGYKCIFTSTDKQSKEKFDALRAFGAEVIVCPTNVDPEDPASYYSVSSRMAAETPNAWKPNQYDNASNATAHYESTGPEIWDQTDGKITHLIVGVGTGGTISGTGKYLKEKNPNIQILGIDTYGSVFKKYKETGIFDKAEIYPYVTEGIGEDFLPKCVDFDVIDHFEKVTDKDAAVFTRELCRKEGMLLGNSAGAAVAGLLQMKDRFKPGDLAVLIFHDHGTRYLGKMFNDEWMIGKGYLPVSVPKTAKDLVPKCAEKVISCTPDISVADAYILLTQNNVSQIPVIDGKDMVGSISDTSLFGQLVENPELKKEKVSKVMGKPFPVVPSDKPLEEVAKLINKDNAAVIVMDVLGQRRIITQYDIIGAMS